MNGGSGVSIVGGGDGFLGWKPIDRKFASDDCFCFT